ncbi:MAG: hypothetical protein IKG91_06685 [Firmicutes bacterium]|nr:hypothetical protein [Bacillota bacterium]
MGLISMKCPACGAVLENLDENREFFFCTYCGNKITYEKQRIEMSGQVSLAGVATAKSLLARGTNALEDGKFDAAWEFFDRALDSDPQMAEAYMGKLAARNHCHVDTDLQQLPVRFTRIDNSQSEDDNMILYRRACQYAKGELKDKYEWINGPYHLAICELHEATQNVKALENQMKREHSKTEQDKKRELSNAESNVRYATTAFKNHQEAFNSLKKWQWKGIIKPIITMVVFIAIVFLILSSARAQRTLGDVVGLFYAAALISFVVVVIKSLIIAVRISNSSARKDLTEATQRLAEAQRDLPQKQQELAQYQAQMAEEKQRFAAYASGILDPLAGKVEMFRQNS